MARTSSSSARRRKTEEDEALRHVYHERMQHLDQRLQRSSSEASCLGRTKRITSAGHSDVDSLVERAGQLCRERRSLRAELETIGHQHRESIMDLKAKLSKAEQGHAELHSERERLRMLLSNTNMLTPEQLQRREADESRMQGLALQVEELGEFCGQLAVQRPILAEEGRQSEHCIEELEWQHERALQESRVLTDRKHESLTELRSLRWQKQHVEAEQLELEKRLSVVGDRFRHALDVSEKETQASTAYLKAKVQNWRCKADKQQVRAKAAKARLARAQVMVTEEAALNEEWEVEVKCMRQEQQQQQQQQRHQQPWHEQQLQAYPFPLGDVSTHETAKSAEMLPLALHHQLLREQTDYYRTALASMEQVLKQQLQLQQEPMLTKGNSTACQNHVVPCRREQGCYSDLTDDAECKRLYALLQTAMFACGEAEACAATSEKRTATIKSSLEACTTQVQQLRRALDADCKAKLNAEDDLRLASQELLALQEESAEVEAQMGSQSERYNERWELEVASEERAQRLCSLESEIIRLQDLDQSLLSEGAAAQDAKMDNEERLRVLNQKILEVDEERFRSLKGVRVMEHRARCMSNLVKGHFDLMRQSLAELRKHVVQERSSFLGDLEVWKRRLHEVAHVHMESHRRCKESIQLEGEYSTKATQHTQFICLKTAREQTSELREKLQRTAKKLMTERQAAQTANASVQEAGANIKAAVEYVRDIIPSSISENTWHMLLARSPYSMAMELQEDLRRGVDLLKRDALARAEISHEERKQEETSVLRETEDHITELQAATAVTEAETSTVEERVCAIEAELHRSSAVESLGTEMATCEADQAFLHELKELRSKIAWLKRKLPVELRRRAADWEAHRLRLQHEHQTLEDHMQSEVEQLLLNAKSSEEMEEVQKELDNSEADISRVQAKRENCLRGAQRHRESLLKTERRLADVVASQAHDSEAAVMEERELTRRHAESIAWLREQLHHEATQADAALQGSLSGLPAELADAAEALHKHETLEASAEQLVRRARAHLGTIV